MGVLVDLELPGEEFVAGRILDACEESAIELESVVPIGDTSVPLLRVFGPTDGFREAVRANPLVSDLRLISESDGQAVYAMEWDQTGDTFVDGLRKTDGRVLSATRRDDQKWVFDLLFETAHSLSAFQHHCFQYGIPIEIERVGQLPPSRHSREYGLTDQQRTALVAALEAGYYEIPRRVSTQDLADTLGISDQAVTERLRRAIRNLGSNTVLRGLGSSRDDR